METKLVNLTQVKVNKHNPRTITQKKMDLLVLSILSFPKMLELRPIVVDEKMDSLGGNMRYQALVKISAMSVEKIKALLETSKDFNQKKGDERKRLIKYWEQWKKNPTVAIADASSLSDEEKKAIERLRLVLTDTGINGFIEDDLLRTTERVTLDEKEDEE